MTYEKLMQGQKPKQECKVQGESCFGMSGSCCAGLRCAFNKVIAQGVCESPKIEISGWKKKEGESCGQGIRKHCGECADGLECTRAHSVYPKSGPMSRGFHFEFCGK